MSTRNDALGTSAYILREQPDIVVLDVNMPGLRGDMLAALLHRNAPTRTPALVLYSSLPSSELREVAAKCGAAGFVEKTGHVVELIGEIERCLGAPSARSPTPSQAAMRAVGKREQILDPTVVSELKSLQTPTRPGFLKELVDAYLGEARQQIEHIAAALRNGNGAQARDHAHKIKGSSRNVGAATLADRCEELEKLALAGDLPGATAKLATVRQEFDQARYALTRLADG